jgi:hypothetical protein
MAFSYVFYEYCNSWLMVYVSWFIRSVHSAAFVDYLCVISQSSCKMNAVNIREINYASEHRQMFLYGINDLMVCHMFLDNQLYAQTNSIQYSVQVKFDSRR